MSSTRLSALVASLKRVGGLDFHVLLTLVFRGWSVVAGGVTLLLLPLWLDPVQQGYYYTFTSLLALQVLFELGLNGIVVQLVSHEAAHLSFHDDGSVTGDAERIGTLVALVRMIRYWYCIAAALFVVAAGAIGWVFFTHQGSLPLDHWAGVWAVLVLATAANLYLSPQLAVIEGTGRVGQVAQLRLIQAIVGFCGLWAMLALGAGLWAATALPVATVVLSLAWLRIRGGLLLSVRLQSVAPARAISWRRDVLPLQWRIAVSWASGYLIFNLFTPVVFAHHGAAEAGRLGLAMAVFSAITTLGLSWINAKAPNFTMHIARGESHALNSLFRSVAIRSTTFTAVLAFSVVAAAALAAQAGAVVMDRVSPPWTLFWLALAAVLNVVVYACACYMRAHREEPMVAVSLVSALCISTAVIATADADVSWMMALYASTCGFVSLPWTLVLLRSYRRRNEWSASVR